MANPDHLERIRQTATALQLLRTGHWSDNCDVAKRRAKGHRLLESTKMAGADLSQANLSQIELAFWDLSRADFRGADLCRAHLVLTHLRGANLGEVNLSGAIIEASDLSQANLLSAELTDVDCHEVRLEDANLSYARLVNASFQETNLCRANLTGAELARTSFTRHNDLRDSNFSDATCEATLFGDLDMSEIRGLAGVHHRGPSTVGIDTIRRSKGRIPDTFLRGCGLSDWEILATKLYAPDLERDEIDRLVYEISSIRFGSAIQISPLFISYAHADAAFVDHVESELNERRIRFWRDAHDLKAGRIERQLERAITMNPTVLLVLSAESVNSDWVEWEASKARELEKELGRDVLCPIALDDAWKTCRWPGPLRRQIEDYHILDFARWQDRRSFRRQFGKLIEGLGLFYRQDGDTADR